MCHEAEIEKLEYVIKGLYIGGIGEDYANEKYNNHTTWKFLEHLGLAIAILQADCSATLQIGFRDSGGCP